MQEIITRHGVTVSQGRDAVPVYPNAGLRGGFVVGRVHVRDLGVALEVARAKLERGGYPYWLGRGHRRETGGPMPR